jgi:hypothetical protein
LQRLAANGFSKDICCHKRVPVNGRKEKSNSRETAADLFIARNNELAWQSACARPQECYDHQQLINNSSEYVPHAKGVLPCQSN